VRPIVKGFGPSTGPVVRDFEACGTVGLDCGHHMAEEAPKALADALLESLRE
jgi:hypothetical protein